MWKEGWCCLYRRLCRGWLVEGREEEDGGDVVVNGVGGVCYGWDMMLV